MPPASKYLEKTRGRILGPAEAVRLVSRVQAVAATSSRYLPASVPIRAKAFLTLTDRRLLLVSESVWARRAELLYEWPCPDLRISITRTKVGSGLIHVAIPGGGRIDFEHIGYDQPDESPFRAWNNLDLRRVVGPIGRSPLRRAS